MSLWRETLRRVAYLGRRRRFDEELDAEVRFHIETRAEELQQSGMPHQKAQAQASREFGSPALIFEDTRAPWRFQWLEDICADLRYAARAFRRNPAFALTAIACLALGVGANTTVFSLATEVLFSQPSVRSPRTLLHLRIGGSSHAPMREYRFLRDARIFEGLAGENEGAEVNWRHGDATTRLFGVRVTDNFFNVTGVPLAIGRPIQPDPPDTVVLTHHLWQQQMGGDPNVIGRKLELDGRLYTVSGVLPPVHRTLMGFGFSPDLYVPAPDEHSIGGVGQIVALYARIPQGMTRQAAYARLQAACRELDRVYPAEDKKWAENIRVSAISGVDHIATESGLMPVAAFFAMLMIVVGLVLLIACANVASLLLARASSRSHELAIRLSIGAGRGRIVRQLLSESLLLALCGTAAGLALNIGVTAMLSRVRLPLPIPVQFAIRPDWRLLSYSVAVSLVSALASGLMPAIKGTRGGIGAVLKHDQGQVGRARWTLRNVLVAGQIAVSIVLLCAGFLFMRNLLQASSMNPGFDTRHTIWAHMRIVPAGDEGALRRTLALIDAAIERLQSLPGVEAAAIARVVPLNDTETIDTSIGTDLDAKTRHVQFNNNFVGPGYFKTMAIPILSGREFLPSDRTGPRVAILNQNMAKRLFGGIDPIGHTVAFEKSHPIRIAGVARNSKYFTLGEENANAWYEPYAEWDGSVNLHFLVRASGSTSPQAVIPAIRAALGQLDRTAALEIKPMRNALAFAMLPSQVGAAILGAMGLLGLLLASIGLYGTLLYAVSRRIREIGLRTALGASPADIMGMVLRQSFALVAAGVGIGIALAIFAVRPLAMFLVPEVRPTDATNFVVVAAVLCAVALAATVAPALRALRVDPVVALRHE